ncbi:S-layer homology domain-containing protein [Xylanibacillus composti]|uniref:S-layer homology domain-containing protein n=1 Tax=Xylanibacillus composti TaxID=1572762 RepID=UPI001BD0C085|nr:S-layer homology domain-containing protein [Xylanibacillus composti]
MEGYSNVAFAILGINNSGELALVDGRTEVFALADSVTFRNYDVEDPQHLVTSTSGGFSSFTTDGQVMFVMKTDELDLEQLTLHSGPTLLQELQEEPLHITYNGNGAEGSAPSDSKAYYPGIVDTVEVLGQGDLTKTGHSFAGWNATGTFSEAVYKEGDTFTISEETTLYAVWTPNPYLVTYNGNGDDGTGAAPSAVTEGYGTDITVSGNTGNLVKAGYSFAGWNTAADGSGTSYPAGSSFTIPASDTTLYAQWKINGYPVTYNGNGDDGTGTVPSAVTEEYGTAVTVSGNTGNLVKAGYSFAGWNTAADGSGTSYPAGSSFTIPASATTLYAQWHSGNAMLGDLSVSPGTLDFNPSQANYTVDVGHDVEKVDIYISKGDPTQTLMVPDAVYQSVTDSVYHYELSNLVVGENPLQIQVAAQDGTDNKYNLIIQRLSTQPLSNNADLSGLTLSNGELSPAFAALETSYTAGVRNGVRSLTVTAALADGNASAKVSVNDGAAVALASGTASGELALNVGVNTISIAVTAEDGTSKTYTIEVTRARSSGGSTGGSGGGGGVPSGPIDQNESDLAVTIDGETEQAIATATASEQNGQAVLYVTVDAAKLTERLTHAASQSVVTIPVASMADKVTVALTGEAVKAMENKQATLDVRTPNGSYTLPASEIAIEQLAAQLGAGIALENITVHVDIAKSGSAAAELLESASIQGNFTVIVPPVDFTVTAEFNGQAVQVTKFNAFVEREIPIPAGVDASMITAAVVLNEDGTTRSVPMKIVTRDGVAYAVINSLTNSTYALVSYPVAFSDVEQHWAKNAVNNMGSRMVISGFEDGQFQPDQAITRAEFAAILVRGLGLKPEEGTSSFSDVRANAWYSSAVNTATAYGLINGFEDGAFRPNDKITREQAMVIIAKAMAITELQGASSEQSAAANLQSFTDASDVSNWAKNGVADSVQAGIVSGRGSDSLAPQDLMTRAEVAAIIERLLESAELI